MKWERHGVPTTPVRHAGRTYRSGGDGSYDPLLGAGLRTMWSGRIREDRENGMEDEFMPGGGIYDGLGLRWRYNRGKRSAGGWVDKEEVWKEGRRMKRRSE